MKLITSSLVISAIFLGGCASPGEATGRLSAGQWSPVRTIGIDRHLIEAYDTEDALAGSTVHCTKTGKKLEVDSIVPHTQRDRATITFRCR